MHVPSFITPTAVLIQQRPTKHIKSTRRFPVATAKRVRRPENVPGDLYVDSSCIDCGTCRWYAPETFHRDGTLSAVHTQPTTPREIDLALQAAVACPTGSIRTEIPNKQAKHAANSFPTPAVYGKDRKPLKDVFYNGYSASATFGASSWLLLHRGKNPCAVMFDCPRFNSQLANRIKALAKELRGVKYLVLSHSDDVAGHERWAKALGAVRVIHELECNKRQHTDMCEMKLSDSSFPFSLDEGLELIHVPGHTKGSIAMFHHDSQSLFAGDHIMFLQREGRVLGGGFSSDVPLQAKSVEKLKDLPFMYGWPGHGRHFHFKSGEERKNALDEAARIMRWRLVRM